MLPMGRGRAYSTRLAAARAHVGRVVGALASGRPACARRISVGARPRLMTSRGRLLQQLKMPPEIRLRGGTVGGAVGGAVGKLSVGGGGRQGPLAALGDGLMLSGSRGTPTAHFSPDRTSHEACHAIQSLSAEFGSKE